MVTSFLYPDTAGEVNVAAFINSLDEVEVSWSNFESPVTVRLYYVGIGTGTLEYIDLPPCNEIIRVSVICCMVKAVYIPGKLVHCF